MEKWECLISINFNQLSQGLLSLIVGKTKVKASTINSLAGFVYPTVTHWAWDENGWLYAGLEYTTDNVTIAVTYQVFCSYHLYFVGVCCLHKV